MCSTLSGRKILFSVFGLIGLLIINSACRKQDREEVIVEKDLIQLAKAWYTNQIVTKENKVLNEPYTVLAKTDDRRVFARMGKMQKLLLWSDAKVFKTENLEYAIVPMAAIKAWQNQKYQGQRAMVFLKKTNGDLKMEIIEVLSLKNAVTQPELISTGNAAFRNRQGKLSDLNYAADVNVIFYDENYKHLSSLRYQNGRWSQDKLQLRNLKGTPDKTRAVSTVTTLSSCNCTDYYLIGYFYDTQTGQIISTHILASYAICEGGSGSPQYGSEPANDSYDACSVAEGQLSELVGSSQATSSVSSHSTEYLDGITRTKLYEWVLRTGGGYKIIANMKGTHTKVLYSTDPNLQWSWQNLEYLNIIRTGLVAIGTVEPSSDYWKWHYSTFISRGYIRYRINYSVSCGGRPVSNIVSYDGWGEFSAN